MENEKIPLKKDGTIDKRSIEYREGKRSERLGAAETDFSNLKTRNKVKDYGFKQNLNKPQGGAPPKDIPDSRIVYLGKDIIEWVKDPKQGGREMKWVEWYYTRHGLTKMQFSKLKDRQGFRGYYEIAREIMASNILKTKETHHSLVHRYLGLYDQEVFNLEERKADLQSERRIKEKRRELQEKEIALKELQESIERGTFLRDISNSKN